jgi:hypothetical protein
MSKLCKQMHTLAWLGYHSPREKIRESGLWLTNELYKTRLGESDIQKLKTYS